MAAGILRIQSYAARQSAPVDGVTVTVSGSGFTTTFITGPSGGAADLEIDAPEEGYSLDEGNITVLPYAVCDITAEKAGWRTVQIKGAQIFAGQVTLARLEMIPEVARAAPDGAVPPEEPVVIPTHPLFAGDGGSGPAPGAQPAPRVLTEVVIPKTITVHLGRPNESARNVTVSFRDYIANVASSEVYPTWVTQNSPNLILSLLHFLEVPFNGDGLLSCLGVLRGNHHPMHQKYNQFPGQGRRLGQLPHPPHLGLDLLFLRLLLPQLGFQNLHSGLRLLHLLQKRLIHPGKHPGINQPGGFIQIELLHGFSPPFHFTFEPPKFLPSGLVPLMVGGLPPGQIHLLGVEVMFCIGADALEDRFLQCIQVGAGFVGASFRGSLMHPAAQVFPPCSI